MCYRWPEAFHGLGVDIEGNTIADRADHAGQSSPVWNRKPRLMVMWLIFLETDRIPRTRHHPPAVRRYRRMPAAMSTSSWSSSGAGRR
jgi:hypothetical protein